MMTIPATAQTQVGQDGARIPLLTIEEMTPEQRRFYDMVVAGPRGRIIGPLRAAIHVPDLAHLWSNLGEYLRYKTCLPARLNELAIIVTGRRWTSQVEWWVHARVGIEAGLPETAITAIGDLEAPVFSEPADLEVYEYARLLQLRGQVPDAIYNAVESRWGTQGVVELTAVIGYYTMVAMTLNAHRIPVPDAHIPLSSLDDLAPLPEGRLVEGLV